MLSKMIMRFLGFVFGILILGFTGMQTFSLLFAATGNMTISVIGLIFFEGGLLYWWSIFQSSAEGLGQMALSAILAGFGLVLVLMAVALELGAVDGEMLGEGTAAKLIVAAAMVNLVGKFLYPLLSPDVSENIFLRTMEGKITQKAYKDAEKKTDELAVGLATTVSHEIARRVEFNLLAAYGLDASGAARKALPSAVPLADGTTVIEGETLPAATLGSADGDDGMVMGFWNKLVGMVAKETAVDQPVFVDLEAEANGGRTEPTKRQVVHSDDSRTDLSDGVMTVEPFADEDGDSYPN